MTVWTDLFGTHAQGSRISNMLMRRGIDSVEKLKDLSDRDLMAIRNMGVAAMDAIHDKTGHCTEWFEPNRQRKAARFKAHQRQGK